MRRLQHCNIVKLKYFFYSGGEKVSLVYLYFLAFGSILYSYLLIILFVSSYRKMKST